MVKTCPLPSNSEADIRGLIFHIEIYRILRAKTPYGKQWCIDFMFRISEQKVKLFEFRTWKIYFIESWLLEH